MDDQLQFNSRKKCKNKPTLNLRTCRNILTKLLSMKWPLALEGTKDEISDGRCGRKNSAFSKERSQEWNLQDCNGSYEMGTPTGPSTTSWAEYLRLRILQYISIWRVRSPISLYRIMSWEFEADTLTVPIALKWPIPNISILRYKHTPQIIVFRSHRSWWA